MLSLTEKLNINAKWPHVVTKLTIVFPTSSLLAFLVLNFDRHLATSYPLFDRISVTKGRLLTLFAVLTAIQVILTAMFFEDSVIPFPTYILILFIFITPPMIPINFKLFVTVRKRHRNRKTSPEIKKQILVEKYFKLPASTHLFCDLIHSSVRQWWSDVKLETHFTSYLCIVVSP